MVQGGPASQDLLWGKLMPSPCQVRANVQLSPQQWQGLERLPSQVQCLCLAVSFQEAQACPHVCPSLTPGPHAWVL